MPLTQESLLVYQGFNDYYGLCHARVYEQPGRLPAVIVGQLEDSPGPSISNAIEMVATAVQSTFFPDGREFRLIEYHTQPSSWPHFVEVTFAHHAIERDPYDLGHFAGTVYAYDDDTLAQMTRGTAEEGDFRGPSFEAVDDVCQVLGADVQEWSCGEYTARSLFGDQGERVRTAVAHQDHQAAARLGVVLEPDDDTGA